MKAKESSLMNMDRLPLGEVVPLGTPLVVNVEISRVCNFKCEFCFQAYGRQENSILSMDHAKKLVDDICEFPDKLKVIKICGFGEPLINPNVVEIAKYMHEKNCADRIVLYTNGSLLNPKISKGLVKYIDKIVISVDGLSNEQFLEFTGARINQEKYYSGVKELCHYAEDSDCTICAKVHNEAVKEKADLEKFHLLYGDICDEVTIETLVEQFPEVPFKGEDESKFRYVGLEKTQKKCCPQIFKSLQTYANGVVVPCCVDYKPANFIGNFQSESLVEIWNGELLRRLQIKHLNMLKDYIPFCKDCSMNDYSDIDNLDDSVHEIKKRMGLFKKVPFMSEKLITKCCICGNEVETKKILLFRDFLGLGVDTYAVHIASCDNCGFIFYQNPLTPEQLENRYKNESCHEFDSKEYMPHGNDDYAKRCHRQKHFVDENISSAGGGYESILEIGAASGYNLSLYEGKRRFGIEPSALNCKLAKKNYGIDMFNGMWSEFLASDKKETYDLIFMSHVLEHIVNPMQFIKECASICNRYMFVEVPCFDIKYPESPFGMFHEEHVNFFSIQSLSTLMHNVGFSMVNAEMIFNPHNGLADTYPAISTIWEKSADGIPIYNSGDCLERYWKENEILLQAVKEKINRIPNNEKLALWGIAHHVGMLLANTSLAEKNIVRVYDSNKRKHGIKIMGLPIQPFNEDDVLSGEVDAILITSYTAQNSISKVIEKMNLPCRVYKLYEI